MVGVILNNLHSGIKNIDLVFMKAAYGTKDSEQSKQTGSTGEKASHKFLLIFFAGQI